MRTLIRRGLRPPGNMHGMSLAAVLGEDNLNDKMNRPDRGMRWNNWDKLNASCSNIYPKIDWSDVVLIALRDVEPERILYLEKT